jgi:hypothetical protein
VIVGFILSDASQAKAFQGLGWRTGENNINRILLGFCFSFPFCYFSISKQALEEVENCRASNKKMENSLKKELVKMKNEK